VRGTGWDRLAAGSVTGAQPATDRDSREFLELGSLLAAVVSSRRAGNSITCQREFRNSG
jgi:hypothetical protein